MPKCLESILDDQPQSDTDTFNAVLKKFGEDVQLSIAIEEMSELSIEMFNMLSIGGAKESDYLGELADVIICLRQYGLMIYNIRGGCEMDCICGSISDCMENMIESNSVNIQLGGVILQRLIRATIRTRRVYGRWRIQTIGVENEFIRAVAVITLLRNQLTSINRSALDGYIAAKMDRLANMVG